MANTRSNVYNLNLQGNRCDKILRVLVSNVQVGTGWLELISFPGQAVQLQFALTDCSLPFKFLNASLFSFLSLLPRDSSRLHLRDINHEFLALEIYIVHVEITREITVSCDTFIELATLSNLYFSFTLFSISSHTHRLLSSFSDCVLEIKLDFLTHNDRLTRQRDI